MSNEGVGGRAGEMASEHGRKVAAAATSITGGGAAREYAKSTQQGGGSRPAPGSGGSTATDPGFIEAIQSILSNPDALGALVAMLILACFLAYAYYSG